MVGILADVLGLVIETARVTDATVLEAGWLALAAAGGSEPWTAARDGGQRTEPSERRRAEYDGGYARYLGARARLRELDREA